MAVCDKYKIMILCFIAVLIPLLKWSIFILFTTVCRFENIERFLLEMRMGGLKKEIF